MFDFSLVDRRHFRFLYLDKLLTAFLQCIVPPPWTQSIMGRELQTKSNSTIDTASLATTLSTEIQWWQSRGWGSSNKPDLSYTLYLYLNVQLRKSNARGQHIRSKIFFTDLNRQSKIILKTQFSLYFVHTKNNFVAISYGHKAATACKHFNLQNRSTRLAAVETTWSNSKLGSTS